MYECMNRTLVKSLVWFFLQNEAVNLGISIVRLHQSRRVHLHPLEINRRATDLGAHLYAVTSTVLAVRRRKVQEIGAVLCEEATRGEVSTEATSADDDRAVLLEGLPIELVLNTAASFLSAHEELRRLRFAHDARLRVVRVLRDLLQHLDERVGDCHTREALSAAVGPGLRVAAHTRYEGQVQVELVHQPFNVSTRVVAQHLD